MKLESYVENNFSDENYDGSDSWVEQKTWDEEKPVGRLVVA
jgi:hypothetical protein